MKKYLLILVFVGVTMLVWGQKPFIYIENGQKISVTLKEMRPLIDEQLKAMCVEMNKQCPMQVDEITTLMSSLYVNKTVQHNYRINIDSSLLSDKQIEHFQQNLKKKQGESMKYLMVDANTDLMPREEWVRLYKELGIQFIYNLRDNKGIVFGRVIVDYMDFM